MAQPRDEVYFHAKWLAAFLAGDQSCEWATWFKAHYQNYKRVPEDFNLAAWQADHTVMLHALKTQRQPAGNPLYIEKQNNFFYKTPQGIKVSGQADLVEITGPGRGIIYDTKTGQMNQANTLQVMLYMYLLPLAKAELAGVSFDGVVVYREERVEIPATAVSQSFKDNVNYVIKALSSAQPPFKAPGEASCRFCDLHKTECQERVG